MNSVGELGGVKWEIGLAKLVGCCCVNLVQELGGVKWKIWYDRAILEGTTRNRWANSSGERIYLVTLGKSYVGNVDSVEELGKVPE